MPSKPRSRKSGAVDPREIQFLIGEATYSKIARRQKRYILKFADALERGAPLKRFRHTEFVAFILRQAAERFFTEEMPRRPGAAPMIDHGVLAIKFAMLVAHKGMEETEAKNELADRYNISVPAVREALKKYGPVALAMASQARTKPPKTKSGK